MKALMALLLTLTFHGIAHTAELFGTVDAISGRASISDMSGKSANVIEDQQIFAGETINTAADSEIHIATTDGGIIAIRPNSVFRVDEYKADGEDSDKIAMSLLKGALRSITGWIGKHNPASYRVVTPNAVIGIRGTDHEVTVVEESGDDEAGTYDTVNEGATVISTPQGEAEVRPGKFAFASKIRAGVPTFLARHPKFLAKRQLRIEQRIKRRKEFFQDRMEQLRGERIKHFKAMRDNKAERRQNRMQNNDREKVKELRRDREEKRQERRQRNND